MKLTPDDVTSINLSPSDMNKAVEYWLNEVILKKPCKVLSIQTANINTGSGFNVEWIEKGNEEV